MTEEKREDIASSTQYRFKWRHIFIIFICAALGVCLLGGNTQILRDERAPEEIKNMMWAIDAVKHVPNIVGVFIILLIPYLLWAFWPPLTAWFKSLNRKAQTNKAETTPQPFDVEQLSDAAIELLVYAALSQEKELRLQDNEIRFGLKPSSPAFYFDFPEQAPANSDVLAELVDCGALTQSRYKYVLNQEFVDKHLDAALEIDAQRIAHSLPEPGRQILNAARQEGGAVYCEHRSASSQAGIYANSSGAVYLGSAPALDVCRVLLMFQKNGLVNQWFLKEGPQSVPLFAPDDLPSHLKFNENAPTHGTITFIGGAPDRWKPYPRQSPNIGWNWAEGRLTKRGEEIAALLSPPAEPSV